MVTSLNGFLGVSRQKIIIGCPHNISQAGTWQQKNSFEHSVGIMFKVIEIGDFKFKALQPGAFVYA
jgi:hypothetical protein